MRRSPTARIAAVTALLVASLALVTAPATAGVDPTTPLPTVVARQPVVIVDFAHVRVGASTPLWTFARTSAGPQVPVSWRTTSTLPADLPVTYDVEFRQTQGLYGPSFTGPWHPLVTGTTAQSASLADYPHWVAQNGEAYEFVVRAVDPATGTAGPWSTPVVANIPLDDNWHHQTWESGDSGDLTFGSHWSILASPYAFYGTQHTTTARTMVVGGLTQWHGHRLYIFGATCPTCGKFSIDLQAGATGHTFTRPVTVDTYSASTHHRVLLYQVDIPGQLLADFQLDTLATPHRPRVILDAWGVGH